MTCFGKLSLVIMLGHRLRRRPNIYQHWVMGEQRLFVKIRWALLPTQIGLRFAPFIVWNDTDHQLSDHL